VSETPVDRPETIGTLRDRHLNLMRRWRGLAADEERAQLAGTLRKEAQRAGANIGVGSERDEAQGIIDYWASSMASLPGQPYPELLVLAPYQGKQAQQAAASAEAVYEALDTPEKQRVARCIFENLLTVGADDQVRRTRPRDRDALLANTGVGDEALLDEVVARFVETCALVRRPGESDDAPRYEVADAKIVESWPALRHWLDERGEYNRRRDRLMAQATRWKEAGKRRDLLLPSRDLENAAEFVSASDLLRDYIEASRTARRQRLAGTSLAAVAFCGAVAFLSVHEREHDLELKHEQVNVDNGVAQSAAELSKYIAAPTADDLKREKSPASLLPTRAQVASRLAGIPDLQGAMWLGSNERPQVMAANGGRLPNVGAAAGGTFLRARAPIFLRNDRPPVDGDYVSPPTKAVIARGAMFQLLETPQPYDRPSGVQYWARVRAVPQVYVQYANGSPQEIDAMRRAVAAAGFEVPQAERRTEAGGKSEVRFFRPEDRSSAALLLATLKSIDFVRKAGQPACAAASTQTAATVSFRIEIWFDPLHAPREGGPETHC
jgi:hypothetical protein